MRQVSSPIIGILVQENNQVKKSYPEVHSFIAASYVKFLESGGARIIPVWIGQEADYYERVVKYTNGLLYPGGLSHFAESNGYGSAAKQIYKLAVKSYDEYNIHYPLFGICLGMEVLAYASAGIDIRRAATNARSISLPLHLKKDYRWSKLYDQIPLNILKALINNNITYNHHQFCLFEEDLKEYGIHDEWEITATNRDVYGMEFISSMEHKKYPFYGVQFHPEKVMFEFSDDEICHTREAREFSQYLANQFVDECGKNINTFPNLPIERNSLIYNYHPVYSGRHTKFQQLYLFKKRHYKKKLLLSV